jgi:hypothetical protein
MRPLGASVPGAFGALLLVLAPQAAPAAQAAPGAVAQDAHRQRALALAQTVQPRELVVASSMAALDRDFVRTLGEAPDVKALEAEVPGFMAAYYDAARPELKSMLEKRLPQLWQTLADIYAAEMSPRELESVLAFYSSPLGQKFVKFMHTNIDARPMLRDGMKNPDFNISAEAYKETVGNAVERLPEQLSTDEVRLFATFLRSEGGRAIGKVAPKVTTAGVAWVNATDPEAEARLEQIAEETFTRLAAGQDER